LQKDVYFFQQGTLPCLTLDGELLLEARPLPAPRAAREPSPASPERVTLAGWLLVEAGTWAGGHGAGRKWWHL